LQVGRFLEPVKAIQVRPFKPKTFVIGQSDGDGVFMGGDEFERAVVIIIMDSFVGEKFYLHSAQSQCTPLVLKDYAGGRGKKKLKGRRINFKRDRRCVTLLFG
jgi:hypothetical protein